MDKTNDEKKYCVYMHRFPNNKVYIGQTCQEPEKRWGNNGCGYFTKNQDGSYSQPLIVNAINKYGWENVEHIILFDNLNKHSADRIEQISILLFKSNIDTYGYNLTCGGGGSLGRVWTQEEKDALSIVKKSMNTCGENNPFYGKHHTEETKIKISNANKGRLVGAKNPHYGKQMSDETKKKISNSKKGKYTGENNPFFGKHLTDEHKKKIQDALKSKYKEIEHPNSLPVLCVELNKIWTNSASAAKYLNVGVTSIRDACNNNNKIAYGNHWMYIKDFSVHEAKRKLLQKNRDRDVPVMCVETGIVYDNIIDACNNTNATPSGIKKCIYKNGQTSGGYHWKIAEEEWLSHRSQWADKIISNLLRNEELMNEINKFRSEH